MTHKRIRCLVLGLLCLTVLFVALSHTTVQGAELFDQTTGNYQYNRYGFEHYQLDYHDDGGMFSFLERAVFAITGLLWLLSVLISNAVGFLVGEAFRLDFISSMGNAVGENIQALTGITRSGITSSGFLVGFLVPIIVVLGVYMAYTGMIKRQVTKAVGALVSFLCIFVILVGYVAYAPSYIQMLNEFSSDVSKTALATGTKIVSPGTNAGVGETVPLLRDTLFAIQVMQPWLLLQFGNTNQRSIGQQRIDALLGVSPWKDAGNARQEAVRQEVEMHENLELTSGKVFARFGIALFVLILNLLMSAFVLMLTGFFIFSQFLFIIYATLLPIVCILSMIPTFHGMFRRVIVKLFNIMMLRAGITLIITIAFSLSSMAYSLSETSPFFLVAVLQIIIFAGIFFKMDELLGMFGLDTNARGFSGKMSRPAKQLFRTLHRHISKHRFANKGTGSAGAVGGTPWNYMNTTAKPNSHNQRKEIGTTQQKRLQAPAPQQQSPSGTGSAASAHTPSDMGKGTQNSAKSKRQQDSQTMGAGVKATAQAKESKPAFSRPQTLSGKDNQLHQKGTAKSGLGSKASLSQSHFSRSDGMKNQPDKAHDASVVKPKEAQTSGSTAKTNQAKPHFSRSDGMKNQTDKAHDSSVVKPKEAQTSGSTSKASLSQSHFSRSDGMKNQTDKAHDSSVAQPKEAQKSGSTAKANQAKSSFTRPHTHQVPSEEGKTQKQTPAQPKEAQTSGSTSKANQAKSSFTRPHNTHSGQSNVTQKSPETGMTNNQRTTEPAKPNQADIKPNTTRQEPKQP